MRFLWAGAASDLLARKNILRPRISDGQRPGKASQRLVDTGQMTVRPPTVMKRHAGGRGLHDLSQYFGLGRRLCQRRQHRPGQPLAGRLGRACQGLPRGAFRKGPGKTRPCLWRQAAQPLRPVPAGRQPQRPRRLHSWRLLAALRQFLLVASREGRGGKRVRGRNAHLHALPRDPHRRHRRRGRRGNREGRNDGRGSDPFDRPFGRRASGLPHDLLHLAALRSHLAGASATRCRSPASTTCAR